LDAVAIRDEPSALGVALGQSLTASYLTITQIPPMVEQNGTHATSKG
jgi:hypothetical protein